jgi:hypothetical protein
MSTVSNERLTAMTAGFNSTLQVRLTSDPMGLVGLLLNRYTEDGDGTKMCSMTDNSVIISTVHLLTLQWYFHACEVAIIDDARIYSSMR